MEKPHINTQSKKALGPIVLIVILIVLFIGMAILSYQHQSIQTLLQKDLPLQAEKQPLKAVPAVKAQPKIIEKIVYKDRIIQAKPKIVEKIVYKDKIIASKPTIIEKRFYEENHPLNLVEFDVFYCYGMEKQSYRLTQKCKTQLNRFLDKRKSFQYFEIIGVINPRELPPNKDALLYSNGLDRLRVKETIWYIKQALGKHNILAVPVTYHIQSNKNQGTLIRAYKQ